MIRKYVICIWYLEDYIAFCYVMNSILLCCVSAAGDVSDVHRMAGWLAYRLAASCLIEKGCTLFLNISPYIEMVMWDKKRLFCRSVMSWRFGEVSKNVLSHVKRSWSTDIFFLLYTAGVFKQCLCSLPIFLDMIWSSTCSWCVSPLPFTPKHNAYVTLMLQITWFSCQVLCWLSW